MQRQFFQPGHPSSISPAWEPPIDVFETDRTVEIIAALPGVEPNDLKIDVQGPEVVISGLRHLPAVTRNTTIHRLEIPYGRFERRIRLSPAKFAVAQFELERGCLTLRLAKRP
ncbi:MAG: Hsp20/alpha crystallin family protein [Hyphomicrobiales bacterium]|nr:Hsp20/alpha crystallin family protein [Hyphomicrobiales bacterium]MBV9518915.1 Hsp20/alpha crystallin family protein [Hyphomicrobiales bacterium]